MTFESRREEAPLVRRESRLYTKNYTRARAVDCIIATASPIANAKETEHAPSVFDAPGDRPVGGHRVRPAPRRHDGRQDAGRDDDGGGQEAARGVRDDDVARSE